MGSAMSEASDAATPAAFAPDSHDRLAGLTPAQPVHWDRMPQPARQAAPASSSSCASACVLLSSGSSTQSSFTRPTLQAARAPSRCSAFAAQQAAQPPQADLPPPYRRPAQPASAATRPTQRRHSASSARDASATRSSESALQAASSSVHVISSAAADLDLTRAWRPAGAAKRQPPTKRLPPRVLDLSDPFAAFSAMLPQAAQRSAAVCERPSRPAVPAAARRQVLRYPGKPAPARPSVLLPDRVRRLPQVRIHCRAAARTAHARK